MAWPVVAALGISAASNLISSGIQSNAADKAAERELNARKAAQDELMRMKNMSSGEYQKLLDDIRQYYAERGSLGSPDDVAAYRNAIENYNPKAIRAEFEQSTGTPFSSQYTKTKEDFINPYYSRIIGDTANSIQHSAAGAGLGRGTGAALNIAKGVSEKSDELYRTAMQDYQNDRDFAYKQYQDAIDNTYKKLDTLQRANEYSIGLRGDLAKDYYNTMDSRQSDLMKAQQDKLNAEQNYATAIAGLY
jgi:hypothetical protein